jgi:UDP-glucose 4-epimerase
MKLVVTGGAGYIGSIVAQQLVESGHDVLVIDNLGRGYRAAVPEGAAFVEADIRDGDALREVFAGGDVEGVLHFAAFALVGESVSQPELYWDNNVTGSLSLLEAIREAGVPRLVFSSTCATYGEPERVPIDEDVIEKPVNPYGQSKLVVDRMISDYCSAHGLAATSLRYFNVAGCSGGLGEAHEPETHLIPNVLRVALGRLDQVQIFGTDYPTPDGTAVRDYIHVEDLGRAHQIAVADRPSAPGEHRILNLGNGAGFSVREVIDAGRSVTGHPIPAIESPRRAGDPPKLVAASAKVREVLGWEAQKPEIETMVADAWEWAQAHPDGYAD